MIQYPIVFTTRVSTSAGSGRAWKSASQSGQTFCAIPPEFDGPGGAFSPEDFFAQAITNCFVATFQVMAEKSRVKFERLEVDGRLIVDRDELKHPCMKDFHFEIKIYGVDQPERINTLVKKTMESGFILNSVKTRLTYQAEIVS